MKYCTVSTSCSIRIPVPIRSERPVFKSFLETVPVCLRVRMLATVASRNRTAVGQVLVLFKLEMRGAGSCESILLSVFTIKLARLYHLSCEIWREK